jgi:hypothetical protein
MPEHSSQLFARNVLALLELLIGEDNTLNLDFDDEIIAGACIVRDGEIVNAGAKATVEGSARPAPAAAAPPTPASGQPPSTAAGDALGGGAQQ